MRGKVRSPEELRKIFARYQRKNIKVPVDILSFIKGALNPARSGVKPTAIEIVQMVSARFDYKIHPQTVRRIGQRTGIRSKAQAHEIAQLSKTRKAAAPRVLAAVRLLSPVGKISPGQAKSIAKEYSVKQGYVLQLAKRLGNKPAQ